MNYISDLGEVVKLLRAHFPYLKFSVGDLKYTESRGGKVLTLKVWDRLAGYLILDPKIGNDEPIPQHKNAWYITYMGVRNSCRRMGVGRQLVLLAQDIANETERPIYTYVATFNTKELNLLQSMDFKVLREINSHKAGSRWLELKYEVN